MCIWQNWSHSDFYHFCLAVCSCFWKYIWTLRWEQESTLLHSSVQFSSVQFSHSFVSLQPHGLQHARPPCPLPTPRAYLNSCPLRWWCHPAVSFSVIPFSSRLQSFPASGSFQMSQFFTLEPAAAVVAKSLQSCPTLCNPMNHSTPGLSVHHHLPEFTQTHVHWVGDAIQPSHPLSSPSPPAFNLSQHQGLF